MNIVILHRKLRPGNVAMVVTGQYFKSSVIRIDVAVGTREYEGGSL